MYEREIAVHEYNRLFIRLLFDMWCFEGCKGCIYILPNSKTSFGKSASDIKLEGDATVSRFHAVVSAEPSTESEVRYKCVINDLSKYGTFVLRVGEKKKLSTNEKFVLAAGDKVQFGLRNSIFTVVHYTFDIAKSNLKEMEVEKLRDIIKKLGGSLSENWQSSCTHLTVPEKVLFTIKLAYALVSAKPIVTIAYWETVIKAIEEFRKLPEINNFLPSMKEECLQARPELLLPKEERKILFRGLSFVHFCTKQYFAYEPLIRAAGGKSCVYPTRKPLTPRDLTAKNAIVIQQPANDSSQFTQVIAADYPVIHRKLNAVKRRMVSDTEILLAILFCSTEKYCNPKFDFGTLLRSTTKKTFSPPDVAIVQDTQDTSPVSDKKKTIPNKGRQRIIPETCDKQYNGDSRKACSPKYGNEKCDTSRTRKNGSDLEGDIFSGKNNKQFRDFIPETCDSFAKNVANESFSGKSNKKPEIVPESCETRSTVNDPCAERTPREVKMKLRENVEFQLWEEISIKEKDNFMFDKDNSMLGKTDSISDERLTLEKNSSLLEGTNSMLARNVSINEKDDSTLEKENLDNRNDDNRGSAKGPRIISIEKIDNGDSREIRADRAKGDSLGKDCTRIEERSQSPRERKLNLFCTFEKNQNETKRPERIMVDEREKRGKEKSRRAEAEGTESKERSNRKEKSRKTVLDWYEKYLNRESMDEILRKDMPRGKIFAKTPVPIPTKKLKVDDFVL